MKNLDTMIATIITSTSDLATKFVKVNPNKVTYISYRSKKLPEGMENID